MAKSKAARMHSDKPWEFLDEWRGRFFTGEWPTVPEMFRISAARFPDRNCLTVFEPDRITLSYREALERTETLAAWLVEHGVQKGDRVAVSGRNSPEWAVAYLAAMTAGAVAVPVDFALRVEEIQNLLSVSEPKFFFIDEDRLDSFASFREGVLPLTGRQPEHSVYRLLPEDKTRALEKIIPPEEEDLAAILFTSGTMGNPKGVMLTHRNLVSDCYIAQSNMNIFHTDVFYALLPIHHAYTMLAVFIEALSVGAEIVFGKSMAVTKMMHELREGRITMLLGVPLLFNKLLAGILKGIRAKGPLVSGFVRFLMHLSYAIKKLFGVNPGKRLLKSVLDKASLSSLRIAISGGGALAPSVFRAFNELGIDFVQGYGLTETSPIITLNPTFDFRVESVGRDFYPNMEIRILDPDEKGIGEIVVKGPMVMKGYYKMPEETRAMFTGDGWLKTGDLGRMDKDRYVYLCGRAKNMIVTGGGKNVYPEEIENEFQLFYDDIEQITVCGYITDPAAKSEGVEAKIYPADDLFKRLNVGRGMPGSEEAVRGVIEPIVEKVNRTLQPYQRISKITLLEEPLEMTTTKKVKRFAANSEAVQ